MGQAVIAALRAKLREWPEAVWLIVVGALVLAVYHWLKRYDPHAGIDGFGGLFALGMGLIEGVTITAMAWLSKRTYTHDWNDQAEVAVFGTIKKPWPEGMGALMLLIVDRIEWAGWLFLWFTLLH